MTTPSYYGLPLLKEPTWTWEVPAYFFVGGAAGAAAVVGAVARRCADGDDRAAIVTHARWIAGAGGIASGALLTADLGRPERFLNMLRVFKLRSPMSVGAWTLTAFSTAAGAAAFADVASRQLGGSVPVSIVGDAAEILAAATGLVMTTYTGVLIGATAIPVWNRHAGLLPVHFAASGLGSAVSLLEMAGHDSPALNALGMLAAAAETATGAIVERDDNPASAPLKHAASGLVTRTGGVLSGPLPLALRIVGMRSRSARRAASMLTLAGALLTRIGWWAAGSASARDPRLALQSPRDFEAADRRRAHLDR